MDRRQRKAQEKRKKRELSKKQARIDAARRPSGEQILLKVAERSPMGPCYVSAGWEDESEPPQLVYVLVTRELPEGAMLPMTVLLDRTCLGVKDAMLASPMSEGELADFVEELGKPYGGMERCEPLFAQSLIFHALDYSRRLGFAPNRDFHEAMVSPRPEHLVETPWHAPERAIYVAGPNDNVRRIVATLRSTQGTNFVYADPLSELAQFDDADLQAALEAELGDVDDHDESGLLEELQASASDEAHGRLLELGPVIDRPGSKT